MASLIKSPLQIDSQDAPVAALLSWRYQLRVDFLQVELSLFHGRALALPEPQSRLTFIFSLLDHVEDVDIR